MIKVLLPVVLTFCLFSCQNPASLSPRQVGTIVVALAAPGGRTVVADLPEQSIQYTVTISNGQETISQSVSSTGSVVFEQVKPGTYSAAVVAYNIDDEPVGAGSSGAGQVLSEGGSLALSVTLSTTQTGTGGFNFSFRLPNSVGVTNASYQLIKGVWSTAGTVPLTAQESTLVGSVGKTDLPSGAYTLLLTLADANSVVLATFAEAVNVWDNVFSDWWLDAQGNLVAERAFQTEEFPSISTSLAGLTVTGDGFEGNLIAFQPDTTEYVSVNNGGTLVLSATPSVWGQKIQFSNNGSTYSDLTAPQTISWNAGEGTVLKIQVTSPSRTATRTYTITLNGAMYITYNETSILPTDNRFNLAFSNGSLYAGNYTAQYTERYDFANRVMTARAGQPINRVGADSQRVYTVSYVDGVWHLNILPLDLGQLYFDVAISELAVCVGVVSDGTYLYFSNVDNRNLLKVGFYDANDGLVKCSEVDATNADSISRYEATPLMAGKNVGPQGVLYDEGQHVIYFSDYVDGAVKRYDLTADSLTTLATFTNPHQLALVGTKLYVMDHETSENATDQSPSYLYSLDLTQAQSAPVVVRTIPYYWAEGLAYDPVNNTLFYQSAHGIGQLTP